MSHVSYEDGKGVIFLSFNSSFIWSEPFCPGRTFYFEDFYCIRNLRQKSRNALEPPQ